MENMHIKPVPLQIFEASVNKESLKLPRYAKVVKGFWKRDDTYGEVWCKIEEIHMYNDIELSLYHPKYGGFAWVDAKDCIFK